MITVNSRKYDGTISRTWTCELVEQRDSLLIVAGEFERQVAHPDLGRIEKGTVSYEYYWLDRWYNIFRFHDPSGHLRNYYCNINMPPQYSGDILDYVDLDIDILVWPDFRYAVLDREDYAANSIVFGYSDFVNRKVEETLNDLLELIEARALPEATEMIATSAEKVREIPEPN